MLNSIIFIIFILVVYSNVQRTWTVLSIFFKLYDLLDVVTFRKVTSSCFQKMNNHKLIMSLMRAMRPYQVIMVMFLEVILAQSALASQKLFLFTKVSNLFQCLYQWLFLVSMRTMNSHLNLEIFNLALMPGQIPQIWLIQWSL